MITYIKGELTAIQDEAVAVEVQGIGYEIICPNPFVFQSLLNQEVKIYTYHHVREDAQLLYGFKNEDQKYLFKNLISVSGIGPKGALAILGGVDIPEFVSAIEREDDKFLTSFPGVGKKTARQIILDLKGKLTGMFTIGEASEQPNVSSPAVSESVDEAKEALKALGYTEKELKPITQQLQQMDGTTDELVRKGLSLLMKK
ncbi:Holliday junction branch migration protein RuvA [Ornithinibacillus halophilus]|uniref:Holliday junction branch migration complex subunit RuvA n=1 Tax=Ornithinibacillus halophilus TaxID=930117 RepID=A0A1M5DG43_9BACI|nr:Holliday junction branch migration protein RuvA [Ornithinibacillus halophilus]SHF65895.1 Holliday junction DNA helicase subunit RuvA [Ornithinibacillus halophilus]